MFECQTDTQFKTQPGPVSKWATPRPHDPGSPDQRSTDGATEAVAVTLARVRQLVPCISVRHFETKNLAARMYLNHFVTCSFQLKNEINTHFYILQTQHIFDLFL